MGQIRLTPDFFRKEMLNYGNVRQVLARELFQNSIDAGATKIDIGIQLVDTPEDAPSTVSVRFADNGRGMDRAVLEDVFFALGKTTKDTTGTIGGFGKARIVTCFGMESYTIRTGSLFVSGSGADYDITEITTAPPVRGTVFEIIVPLSVFGPTLELFTRAFCDYLSFCQMDCDVRINGVRWTSWTYRRKLVRRVSFGDVHVNKSADYSRKNRMLIRVGGVLMYEKYISADVLIVVEINPCLSRTVLLSNRDRLHYAYENELEKFAQQLAVDTASALRTTSIIKQVLPGEPRKFIPKHAIPKLGFNTKTQEVQQDLQEAQQDLPAYRVSSEAIPAAQSVGNYSMAASIESLGLGEDDDEDYTDPITEGMVFLSESTDARIRKSAALYHPSKWTHGKGSRRRKLLAQWVLACEYALEEYCFLTGVSSVNWRWGWYFSDDARAACEDQADGSHALILNPIHGPNSSESEVGTMRYAIREFNSHVSLVTLACHEVAHLDAQTHDEGFARMFTNLTCRVMAHIRQIHQDMVSAS